MTDGIHESNSERLIPAIRDAKSGWALTSTSHGLSTRYLKVIDNARKALAITFGIVGLAFIICVHRDDYLHGTLRRDSGLWGQGVWLFGIGMCVCLFATLVLILENLARPMPSKPHSLQRHVVRTLGILPLCIGLFAAIYYGYGFGQAVGAVAGMCLLISAARETGGMRVAVGALSIAVIGLTLMGMRSSYQFALRHADEIVAAGVQIAEQVPRPSGEIEPSDPVVPPVLRKLGARRIWVDEERVAVFVGGDIEYQISLQSHPTTTASPVWASRGKGSTKITDRLRSNDY